MTPVGSIDAVTLLAEIHEELLRLLRGLHDEDWNRPTVAGAWTVKDLAAHLLDSDLRRLSFQRDGAPPIPPDGPIASYADLVGFLNGLNADWVRAARRISPKLLIEFLAVTGPQVAAFFASLDPEAPAPWSVAWAGEQESPNWFDIAREYTEKWHHQQQIRDAVGAPPLYERKWLYPLLDTFLRGLPHTYRDTPAEDGTRITVTIPGEAGGDWTLLREASAWRLFHGREATAACVIQLDADTAWRLLTKGLSREQAATRIAIHGEPRLGEPILGMLSVMA